MTSPNNGEDDKLAESLKSQASREIKVHLSRGKQEVASLPMEHSEEASV